MTVRHPVGQRAAAAFHGAFVIMYLLAIWFHGLSALRHWYERRHGH